MQGLRLCRIARELITLVSIGEGMVAMSRSLRKRSVRPFRTGIVALECLVAVGGIAGTIQLWTGTYAPPVDVLEPLGLTSWKLPALWLFATVVVPSTVPAWLAWRKSPHAPTAVLVAAAALLVELVVQIPFVGPDVLQAGFAVALAAAAFTGRNRWDAPGDPIVRGE